MKITLTDNTEIQISYINQNSDENVINIGIKTDESYDVIKEYFVNKELTNVITVINSEGETISVYNNYTTLKNMSVNYDIVNNTNDYFIVLKYAGIEDEVDSLKENLGKLQDSLKDFENLEENINFINEQILILTDCILEMSEIIYAG